VGELKRLAGWVWLYGIVSAWALIDRFLRPASSFPMRLNNVVVLVSIPIWVTMVYRARVARSRELRIRRSGLIIFLLFVLYNNLFWIHWFPALRRGGNFEFIGFAILLCCLGYVALVRAQRNEERLFALNKELEIARGIQAQLLPQPIAPTSNLTIASRYVPATSVAGDFFDVLNNNDGLGVLIADVSGHGIPAALSASMVKVAVRAQMDRAADPAEVLHGMNSILCGNLQGQFVSAGYLFLNPARNTLVYAGAGHPPLLVYRSCSRIVESLEENGFPLGIFPEGNYKAKSAPLENGDRCVLYTDGLLEAPCPSGEEFGLERLRSFMAENVTLPAQAFCDRLVQRLSEWSGPAQNAHDDLTIVVVDFA
jgi:sigma-B regulation protein RsbU (phosphoserine phosphatase)